MNELAGSEPGAAVEDASRAPSTNTCFGPQFTLVARYTFPE